MQERRPPPPALPFPDDNTAGHPNTTLDDLFASLAEDPSPATGSFSIKAKKDTAWVRKISSDGQEMEVSSPAGSSSGWHRGEVLRSFC